MHLRSLAAVPHSIQAGVREGGRAGMPDHIVAPAAVGATAFRRRPWQQLATVVARTRPEDVPAEERAWFEAQLGQLDEQIQGE